MASTSIETARQPGAGQQLIAAVSEQGSIGHPYVHSDALLNGPESARNLADLIHYLCTLHGRYPGVIDHAAARVVEPGPRAWLANASHILDRKSTRLNSSHGYTSYAVFCSKKKKSSDTLPPAAPGRGG